MLYGILFIVWVDIILLLGWGLWVVGWGGGDFWINSGFEIVIRYVVCRK